MTLFWSSDHLSSYLAAGSLPVTTNNASQSASFMISGEEYLLLEKYFFVIDSLFV